MSRKHPGRFHIAIPGPTNIPERILNAIHISSEDQRNPEIPELTIPLYKDVKRVFKSEKGVDQDNDLLSDDLESLVEAYKKIVAIRTTVGPELKALKKESEKKALKKEAGKEMRKAIQDTGLSVQRFNAIIQKLDNNPELRKRFSALMKKQ